MLGRLAQRLAACGGVGRKAGHRLFAGAADAYPNFPAKFGSQLKSEISSASTSRVHFFGFIGGLCNWFLGASALYDATQKGPDTISMPMTLVMLCYSSLFARWAGWAVGPRNYILCGSHIFNVLAQANQLRRVVTYEMDQGHHQEIVELGQKAAIGAAIVTGLVMTRGQLQALVAPYGPAYLSSLAGPFTIHPWPPATKLVISGTSLMELDRPVEKISLPQYSALTLTGAIFSVYGLCVMPVNYPLFAVNVLLFGSSLWHVCRKVSAEYM